MAGQRRGPCGLAGRWECARMQRQTPGAVTHLGPLFICYAGRSRLCVLWASLWQRAVGRHFPGSAVANIKTVGGCYTSAVYSGRERRPLPPLRCWWQALGCTGGCRSPA